MLADTISPIFVCVAIFVAQSGLFGLGAVDIAQTIIAVMAGIVTIGSCASWIIKKWFAPKEKGAIEDAAIEMALKEKPLLDGEAASTASAPPTTTASAPPTNAARKADSEAAAAAAKKKAANEAAAAAAKKKAADEAAAAAAKKKAADEAAAAAAKKKAADEASAASAPPTNAPVALDRKFSL